MIRQRVMVFTHIKMELNIKDLGRMTNSMEQEKRHGQMELHMRGIMCLVKSMEEVHLYGQMDLFIMANFNIIILRELVNINGLMVDLITVIGKIIKCMDRVYSFGLMEEDMKENILKTKRQAMESFTGLMEENMQVNGDQESNMEEAHLQQLMDNKGRESGTMANELDGQMSEEENKANLKHKRNLKIFVNNDLIILNYLEQVLIHPIFSI